MAQKLTNALRDAMITTAIVTAKIPEKREALREKYAVLAEKIRIEALGGAERAAEVEAADTQIRAIAERFNREDDDIIERHSVFKRDCDISLYIGDVRSSYTLYFNGTRIFSTRMEHIHKTTPSSHKVPEGHVLADEFRALEKEQKHIEGTAEAIRVDITATFSRARTVENLLKIWPEAKKLLPMGLVTADADIPARLNETLGLAKKPSKKRLNK